MKKSDAALAGLTLVAVAKKVVRTQGPLALLAGFTPNAAGSSRRADVPRTSRGGAAGGT